MAKDERTRGNTGESKAAVGTPPSQIMGGARQEGVPSFRRCGRSHEVGYGGSPAWFDPGRRETAGLGTVAPGGGGEVEAVLKRPVPEHAVGRRTLGPSLGRMGVGERPGNSGRRQDRPRAAHMAGATHARRGKAAAGTGPSPPSLEGCPGSTRISASI